MLLHSHGLTDPGCRRTHNEDRILFDDGLGLYVVCDGIGGRRQGEVAADVAINTLRQYVESSRDPMEITWPYGFNAQLSLSGNRLFTALKLANRQVWRRSEQSLECLGMGTTIAAVLVDPNRTAIGNIGDSRVYLSRGGAVELLSTDDVIIEPYLNQVRAVLTRAAGSQENVEVHLRELTLEAGDRMLLSSDGLHTVIPHHRLASILTEVADPARVAETLISEAKQAGAPDNVSAVLFDCTSRA